MAEFQERISQLRAKFGPVCLGIDPSDSELNAWDLPDTATGAREFGLRLVEAAHEQLGFVKPQVGFFERFGSAGFVALEQVMASARDAGLFVIADAKRGDIGSTMLGYAQAWFGDDSPLRADALTVSGYLGPESLIETLQYAKDVKGGLFLLAATSNPEAVEFQLALKEGKTVSALALESAQRIGDGCMGVVIGATQDLTDFGIDSIKEADCGVPILAPGFGAQGAKLENLTDIFGASANRVIANLSRELTKGGAHKISDSIQIAKDKV